MNQQTITAFNTFNSCFSAAVNALHQSLQQTNSLSNSIYSDQLTDIEKFQQQTTAFTQFLTEQHEYHKKQYTLFKSKLTNSNNTQTTLSTKPSSQISIQSTPQNWSYTGSVPDCHRWRGYDSSHTNTAYNDCLFTDADIERIPFKVIDTDNDSECLSEIQFVPSLPPSAPQSIQSVSYDIGNDDEKKNEIELCTVSVANIESNEESIEDEYDVCDGIEDDEKWDLYPLIKTQAFTGFFESEPTAQLEFKNDKVMVPPPTKWQEREEQNREIINTLCKPLANEPKTSAVQSFVYTNNERKENESVESVMNNATEPCTDMMAANEDSKEEDSSDIIGMKRRRSMSMLLPNKSSDSISPKSELISKHVSFRTKQYPPIKFIEYDPPKPDIYPNIESHPHYHVLIHGNGNGNGNEETDSKNEETVVKNGEDTEDESGPNQMSERFKQQRNDLNGSENGNGNEINKGIVTLQNALDHHFNVNHNDLTQVKEAIYCLRNSYCDVNRKKQRQIQEQWRIRQKKTFEHK